MEAIRDRLRRSMEASIAANHIRLSVGLLPEYEERIELMTRILEGICNENAAESITEKLDQYSEFGSLIAQSNTVASMIGHFVQLSFLAVSGLYRERIAAVYDGTTTSSRDGRIDEYDQDDYHHHVDAVLNMNEERIGGEEDTVNDNDDCDDKEEEEEEEGKATETLTKRPVTNPIKYRTYSAPSTFNSQELDGDEKKDASSTSSSIDSDKVLKKEVEDEEDDDKVEKTEKTTNITKWTGRTRSSKRRISNELVPSSLLKRKLGTPQTLLIRCDPGTSTSSKGITIKEEIIDEMMEEDTVVDERSSNIDPWDVSTFSGGSDSNFMTRQSSRMARAAEIARKQIEKIEEEEKNDRGSSEVMREKSVTKSGVPKRRYPSSSPTNFNCRSRLSIIPMSPLPRPISLRSEGASLLKARLNRLVDGSAAVQQRPRPPTTLAAILANTMKEEEP